MIVMSEMHLRFQVSHITLPCYHPIISPSTLLHCTAHPTLSQSSIYYNLPSSLPTILPLRLLQTWYYPIAICLPLWFRFSDTWEGCISPHTSIYLTCMYIYYFPGFINIIDRFSIHKYIYYIWIDLEYSQAAVHVVKKSWCNHVTTLYTSI